MLQSIRDRLSGPIVWFVIGLICIPFAFWGVESFRGGGSDPAVAKVGDKEITQAEFRQGYEQRYQQLVSLMGENFRPEMIDQARFRQNVINDMVQESLMRQYTQAEGYRATDAAVFDYLSSVPAFQENGKFSAQLYRDLLARRGMNPQTFESQLRSSLVIDQLRETIVDSAFVSSQEAALAYRLEAQQRDVSVALFSVEKLKAAAQVTDAQVSEHYQANKSRYTAPERLKLSYVDLDVSQLPKAENPGADVLKTLYDAEKDSRFASPEERKARHILVNFGADKSEAKKKIEKFAEQIKGGADFATLAKENSDDTGSKAAGGDLGWVRRGVMVGKFEEALFGLKQGQVSDPVETEFGWHLIQLEELKAPAIRPFEDAEVQAELLDVYQQRDLQKRFQEKSEKLGELAFENPTSLDAVAKALDLKVQTTDWFTREGGAGILADDGVKQAAFSTEVLTDNENSKPLPLGQERVVVIRKAEYEAPRERKLEEVAETIKDEIKLETAKTQVASKADELIKALQTGLTLQAAADAAGASVAYTGTVKRTDAQPDRATLDAAFRLPRPADGKTSTGKAVLANGDVSVVVLSKVTEPSAADASAASSERSRLREQVAGAEFGSMRKALEKEIKVEIKQTEVDEAATEGEGVAP
ncbi:MULTISPECIES: SurA N-terminal domain-containing protein [Hydrocarboniphaga]|uniref:Periplasmic chaperone PpiD n=1 Tax=Hydrocarboniphaga effusa AP103 TaxID=1172194 RepID=I8T4Y4_9GAMM|nr:MULTISPECIES: SurA N-terminal domain-containing protein [Hydrocarboniphaga]EIT68803.1 hypothetical protein WQQ_39980 [Hydrocarboniphaga effusa AP103]MDZ4076853.1 SurA N-terminal domain-containing protein [Hydrocarboniphaga sp.]